MTGSDLVARLRAMSDGQHDDHTIGDEAADEIERLTAERDEAASRCEKLRELADQSAYESGVAFRRLAQAQERRAMARKAERARCIRAIQRMPVPIDQADGARRAIAALAALEDTLETKDGRGPSA